MPLTPEASPAGLLGAQLRALRTRQGLSAAALGRLVHVSGDLLAKIEKAERRPQPDLVARLDSVLGGDGALENLAREITGTAPAPACAEAVPDVVDALLCVRSSTGSGTTTT